MRLDDIGVVGYLDPLDFPQDTLGSPGDPLGFELAGIPFRERYTAYDIPKLPKAPTKVPTPASLDDMAIQQGWNTGSAFHQGSAGPAMDGSWVVYK